MAKKRRRKRRMMRVQRHSAPGSMPGTVAVHPDSPKPAMQLVAYGPDELKEEQIDDLNQLKKYLDKPGVTWVNVEGLGDAKTIQKLGKLFGLHSLALEDVVNVHQRAKVDEYGDHLFIVVRMICWNGVLETEQVSMFLGKNFLLTFQERRGDCFRPVRERLRKAHGRVRQSGADYLAYALIDTVVDAYFPAVDDYGERLEQLDDQLSYGHMPHVMEALHDIRGDLMLLRRAVRPLRDALIRLMPDPDSLISDDTQFHLRDCYDHTIQLMDLLDTYREMCSDLRDYYMSAVSNRMNDVMKVLTIIATIFIPLSFITGLYGMNFKYMPELSWPLGYPLALILMCGVASGLLFFFWRRGWLRDASLMEASWHANSPDHDSVHR